MEKMENMTEIEKLPCEKPQRVPKPLTRLQIKAIIEFAYEHGRKRKQSQGKSFNEVDFFCGVMVAFFALGRPEKIPCKWIFGPMSGRDILEDS